MYYANHMVWVLGMGKSGLLGNWQMPTRISEDIKSKLDSDVQEVLNSCLTEVTALLKKEELLLDRLAKELVTKSELNYDEIEAIFKEFGKNRA